jgi:hypothetical protein
MLMDEWFPDVSKDHSAFIFYGQSLQNVKKHPSNDTI